MRAAIVTAVIVLILVALPFVVGFCAFRVDSFYHLKGQPEIIHGPLVVRFNAIRCLNGGQTSSIPGALAPNDKANGFQIGWELKGDFKTKLTVENIRAEAYNGDEIKPLDVPFAYWAGEFNAAKNVFYAFLSTGGYPGELPLGVYHIRLSYTANGTAYRDDVKLDYVVDRRFAFHTFFYSKYFGGEPN